MRTGLSNAAGLIGRWEHIDTVNGHFKSENVDARSALLLLLLLCSGKDG